ncbi:MAG: ABC transporter ATP-binding protein [Clostridium sp.]
MLMKVENLTCGYGGKNILKDINFSIGKGELWCILGPNGVGKTTLFKTILGLIKPKSGNIYIGNKEINKWNQKEISKMIAYVPQVHIPPFPFKVMDVILMGRNPHCSGNITEKDLNIAEKAINLLNIGYLKDVPYTEISGGERQLVLIARAISQETSILVLDEPVSNLDFGNQIKVIEYLREIVKMGKTVIMTSHFPDNAFLPESNLVLLGRDNFFRMGKGNEVLTQDVLRKIYNVDSRIVDLNEFNIKSKVCVPIYKA